jgi:hypothetical protein
MYIYILLLHRVQPHVSALDNGHLQVVHESLSKQLYKHIYIYMGYLYGRGRACAVIKLIIDNSMIGIIPCLKFTPL